MADVFFFLPFEGVEPVCLQLFRHAPRQLEAAVKLISLDSTSNVFCASNSRSSFLRPAASMSRRSSSWAYSTCSSNSLCSLTVETLLQGFHVVVHCGTSFLATTTHTTTRRTKLLFSEMFL